MTKPVIDYHMHTPLCGHARGLPGEYAAQALKAGLKEIGFSDHAPLVAHEDPKVAMSREQLPEYLRMIEAVREEFQGRLSIKIALEADYIEGCEEKTRSLLSGYAYDYIIGSVHFIGAWGFDNPAQSDRWQHSDVDKIYREYYRLLRKSAETGFFNIMGHVDLVKKFGNRPKADMAGEITKTAEVFKAAGVAVEINTAGLRKPVSEMYPSLDALKIYRRTGVPLTFGSDAHAPGEVGADFDKARDLARAAGYTEYLVYKNRKIENKLSI